MDKQKCLKLPTSDLLHVHNTHYPSQQCSTVCEGSWPLQVFPSCAMDRSPNELRTADENRNQMVLKMAIHSGFTH